MKLNEITIEITQQCPNKCVHCSSLSSPTKTTCLSLQTVMEVVDDAVSLGCELISLSGGEPFLYPELPQIVNHIAGHNIQCNIYTSGICYVEGKPTSVPVGLIEGLKGKVWKYIVNVESSDEATYDNILGTSFHGFDMMKQFISDAVAMGEVVEAHFVPMKLNYQQIPSVLEMCNQWGVSKVSFLRFVAQGRGFDNVSKLLLDDTEMREARQLMKECLVNKTIDLRIGIPFIECDKRLNCLAGISKLDVRYDGKVYPCEAFKNENLKHLISFEADNVKERSLKEIYNKSEHLLQTRKLLGEFQYQKTRETCMNQFYTKHDQNEPR